MCLHIVLRTRQLHGLLICLGDDSIVHKPSALVVLWFAPIGPLTGRPPVMHMNLFMGLSIGPLLAASMLVCPGPTHIGE